MVRRAEYLSKSVIDSGWPHQIAMDADHCTAQFLNPVHQPKLDGWPLPKSIVFLHIGTPVRGSDLTTSQTISCIRRAASALGAAAGRPFARRN